MLLVVVFVAMLLLCVKNTLALKMRACYNQNIMNNTLHWKKTIGILSIILGTARFVSGVFAYVAIFTLKYTLTVLSTTTYYSTSEISDIKKYISWAVVIVPFELVALIGILVLGIILLSIKDGIPANMPRIKSRKICYGILSVISFYLGMEGLWLLGMPSIIADATTLAPMFISFAVVCVLILFCVLGLRKNINNSQHLVADNITPSPNQGTTKITNLPLDKEIADLKKQIEKRKLEKELEQINAEKQAEIEKLKQELEELE